MRLLSYVNQACPGSPALAAVGTQVHRERESLREYFGPGLNYRTLLLAGSGDEAQSEGCCYSRKLLALSFILIHLSLSCSVLAFLEGL